VTQKIPNGMTKPMYFCLLQIAASKNTSVFKTFQVSETGSIFINFKIIKKNVSKDSLSRPKNTLESEFFAQTNFPIVNFLTKLKKKEHS
jgi:hypothetical protein